MNEPAPDAPLPPVHIAEIDHEKLRELFCDVESLGEHIEIVLKHGSEGYVDPGSAPSITDAMTQLLLGTALGVQLRYRFKGADWWDTVMRTTAGFRLVRIQRPQNAQDTAS